MRTLSRRHPHFHKIILSYTDIISLVLSCLFVHILNLDFTTVMSVITNSDIKKFGYNEQMFLSQMNIYDINEVGYKEPRL